MTEAEWLVCEDPDNMRELLRGWPDLALDRKLRLWACSCCRRIWRLVTDVRCYRCVEVAEKFADGSAGTDELDFVYRETSSILDEMYDECERIVTAAGQEFGDGYSFHEGFLDMCCVYDAFKTTAAGSTERERGVDSPSGAADDAAEVVACAADPQPLLAIVDRNSPARQAARAQERSAQAGLLRCIFGNPFRPVTFSPSWRTSTAVTLAAQMYESREFSVMPILADALQDAGCDNAEVLNHCRAPSVHVRGCGVVDLVLGKE